MRKNRKPFGRWVGEALLIFVSVFGAFYLDNLRQEKSEEKLYLRYLEEFKSDLEDNQGKFAYELNKVYNRSGQGYIDENIRQLENIDSLFSLKTREAADSLLKLIEDRAIIGISEWIFTSQQYDMLAGDYYSFIQNPELKRRLELHSRNNQSRTEIKEIINAHISQFEDIVDQMDWSAGASLANRNILFSNPCINKIKRTLKSYQNLRGFTEFNKSNDSLLLIEVNKELELWGIDVEEEED